MSEGRTVDENVVWRVPDVQDRLVRFLSLQSSILHRHARTEPALNDFAVFAELGSGWEANARPAAKCDLPDRHYHRTPTSEVGLTENTDKIQWTRHLNVEIGRALSPRSLRSYTQTFQKYVWLTSPVFFAPRNVYINFV